MGGYAVLFICVGPWFTLGSGTPHRGLLEVLVGLVLALLAASGSRFARMVLIVAALAALLAALLEQQPLSASPGWWLVGCACYLTELCLLVSTPMYLRTRPAGSPRVYPLDRFLPRASLWLLPVGLVAGAVATVVPVDNFRLVPFPCPAGQGAAGVPCLANGAGYPSAYRFDFSVLQMPAGNVHWLSVLAPHGIQLAALASDWARWSLAFLIILYLGSLALRREIPPPPRPALSPSSAP
jgi:hypothetical protein